MPEENTVNEVRNRIGEVVCCVYCRTPLRPSTIPNALGVGMCPNPECPKTIFLSARSSDETLRCVNCGHRDFCCHRSGFSGTTEFCTHCSNDITLPSILARQIQKGQASTAGVTA